MAEREVHLLQITEEERVMLLENIEDCLVILKDSLQGMSSWATNKELTEQAEYIANIVTVINKLKELT